MCEIVDENEFEADGMLVCGEDNENYNAIDFSLPLDEMLLAMNDSVCRKLDILESKVDVVDRYCHNLEQKFDNLLMAMESKNKNELGGNQLDDCEIGVSVERNTVKSVLKNTGSKINVITLNSEEDFPDGTWLGDETNPETRVRCHLTALELLHIETCPTPEKMALALTDYLFDRETQACSNISGLGKHKKRQLDPLMIYGIKCHLKRIFNISDKEWQRIKQNIDSKCRTAFRRKVKGKQLVTKPVHNTIASRIHAKSPESSQPSSSTVDTTDVTDTTSDHDMDITPQPLINSATAHVLTLHQGTLTISSDFAAMVDGAQVIQTADGTFQVLHATPEQLATIEQTHQIQIMPGGQLISVDDVIQEVQHEDHLAANISNETTTEVDTI